jgi:hypothetical protein
MTIIRTCSLDSAIESISNSLNSCTFLNVPAMPPAADYTGPDLAVSGNLSRAHSADNTRSYSHKIRDFRFTSDRLSRFSQESTMFPRMSAMKHGHKRRSQHNFHVGLLTHCESRKTKRCHRSSSSTVEAYPPAKTRESSMSQSRSDPLWDLLLQ